MMIGAIDKLCDKRQDCGGSQQQANVPQGSSQLPAHLPAAVTANTSPLVLTPTALSHYRVDLAPVSASQPASHAAVAATHAG
jgi:hypothetical protein